MIRIGVDVGGTFTDFVMMTDSGLTLHKVLSTPADPAAAILQGLDDLGVDLAEVTVFAHGTTVTTNAVIQRRGTPTGLLTTRGFRDVLQIRRTTRGKLYDFQWDPPDELVPREWRREVTERTNAAGVITCDPDIDGALGQAADLLESGIAALAICFINSYLNGENERVVRAALQRAHPELPIFISSEILPEWREFERTSTTVVSAYVGPVLTSYVRRLEASLRERGYNSDLLMMLSNGGLAVADAALTQPAYTLVSGPAAGVIAQIVLSDVTDLPNLIGMDIGGTSTDISLVYRGSAFTKTEFDLEFGTVVSYPVIDIDSIGAGGGTIAWVDEGGLLHAGPQSAGASPGPACLMQGGTEPTVTDANVVLQRLNPRYLLGGRVPISRDAAREAVEQLGERVGLDVIAMARGILALTTANIVHSIRQRTIERGLDPRDFALVAYGGAGPLHAVDVARDLGVSTVLVPSAPGVTAALGLLFTDVRHDFVATVLKAARDVEANEIMTAYADLVDRGRSRLVAESIPSERMSFLYYADLRYVGQTHELTVQLPGSYSSEIHATLGSLLYEVHLREFGHAPPSDEPVEIVNIRVACLGHLDRPELVGLSEGPPAVPIGERDVYFDDAWARTTIYERRSLRAGDLLRGPTVIEQLDSTVVVPPGWMCAVDELGNLLLHSTSTMTDGTADTAAHAMPKLDSVQS